MKSYDLWGSWLLAEFSNIDESGLKRSWTGSMSGRLIYASPNVVSVAINRYEERSDGTKTEYNSFYCGRFEWDGNGTVVHHVEQASDLRRVGDRYVRTAKLDADVLELYGAGLTGQVHLVWRREKTGTR